MAWVLVAIGIAVAWFYVQGLAHKVQFENEKLTCRRCNQLASPIGGTGNRYRCDKCGRQFAAARHSF
jgi:tRNA(Ile2) C34 agmatinyltransferase TiaS